MYTRLIDDHREQNTSSLFRDQLDTICVGLIREYILELGQAARMRVGLRNPQRRFLH